MFSLFKRQGATEIPPPAQPTEEQIQEALAWICSTASARPIRRSEIMSRAGEKFGKAATDAALQRVGKRLAWFASYLGCPKHITRMIRAFEDLDFSR